MRLASQWPGIRLSGALGCSSPPGPGSRTTRLARTWFIRSGGINRWLSPRDLERAACLAQGYVPRGTRFVVIVRGIVVVAVGRVPVRRGVVERPAVT